MGLLIRVAHDLGLTTWDLTGYGEQIDTGAMRRQMEAMLEYVGGSRVEPQLGDVLLFSIKGSPQHLGMATDVGIIHAYQSVGRVAEHSFDKTWQRRLVGVFRWPGILIGEGVTV